MCRFFFSSELLSQIVSNVPYAALYLPLLSDATVKGMVALAAGNSMGRNLFILGAESSAIII
jgi:Na+/H+ antiporter NhaD/arsenite permease-like protein